jgi:hypothetical protein
LIQQGIAKPEGYDFIYFDWDHSKVTCLRNNEPDTFEVHNLRKLIESLTKPTVLIGETTFESYKLGERKFVFDLAKTNGHLWYGTPNRETDSWRRRLGWKKSDDTDAHVLRVIAEFPGPLKDLRDDSEGVIPEGKSKRAKKVYGPVDRLDILSKLAFGEGSWKRLREINVDDPAEARQRDKKRKDAFSEKQASAMEYRRQEATVKKQLTRDLKFEVIDALGVTLAPRKKTPDDAFASKFPNLTDSVIWAVVFAAHNSKDRNEFEALLGLHAHGAKSLLRSQVYYHGWRWQMDKDVTFSEYRNQIRRLRAVVKAKHITLG